LLHLVGSSVLLYLRNNIYSKKFRFTLVVHKESENENLNGNQWLFYCIATSDCSIALQPVTVVLHCNQWLFYCIATSDCCIALQPVIVLLHCPSIVIKTKVAVLNFGKRTKWTSKNLPAISIVGESRSEFYEPCISWKGENNQDKYITNLVYIIMYLYGLMSKFYVYLSFSYLPIETIKQDE
jgi:hypothetical protein